MQKKKIANTLLKIAKLQKLLTLDKVSNTLQSAKVSNTFLNFITLFPTLNKICINLHV